MATAPMQAEVGLIKSMIANVRAAIGHVRAAAQQLPTLDRWATLLAYICRRIVGQLNLPTPPPALARAGELPFLGLSFGRLFAPAVQAGSNRTATFPPILQVASWPAAAPFSARD